MVLNWIEETRIILLLMKKMILRDDPLKIAFKSDPKIIIKIKKLLFTCAAEKF